MAAMAVLGAPEDFCPSSLNLLDKIYFLNSRHQGGEWKMNKFATFKVVHLFWNPERGLNFT